VFQLSLVKWRDVLLKKLQKTVTAATVELFRRQRNGDTVVSKYLLCVRDSYGKVIS
jgi:hypothetical protein